MQLAIRREPADVQKRKAPTLWRSINSASVHETFFTVVLHTSTDSREACSKSLLDLNTGLCRYRYNVPQDSEMSRDDVANCYGGQAWLVSRQRVIAQDIVYFAVDMQVQ